METVKEKLNKLIHTAADYSVEMCERYVDCNSCPHFGDSCYAMTDYLIQNGVTIQKWVSVDERLPEDSGDYLVIANSGSIFRYYYSHEELEFGEYVEIELDFVEKPDTVWISLDTITHWMPIPALPKGVQ